MYEANAGCDHSARHVLATDVMNLFLGVELHELLIPSNYNNTEIKKICLAVSLSFCRQNYQTNMLGLMLERYSL